MVIRRKDNFEEKLWDAYKKVWSFLEGKWGLFFMFIFGGNIWLYLDLLHSRFFLSISKRIVYILDLLVNGLWY